MFRRSRLYRLEGANFSSHDGARKNPKKDRKPFIIDERPPPVLSLEWLHYQTIIKWGIYACFVYAAIDFARYVFYRVAPTTIPLQPDPRSTVVSRSVHLATPCHRYPGCNVVMTEAHVENDTANYMPAQASTSLQHDLPHHQPRRTVTDRLREVREFFGYVAEKIASSIVVISVVSPYAQGDAAPPKDEEKKAKKAPAKLDPFIFDAPASQWPTPQEQEAAAHELSEKQQKRLEASDEDLWGRRGLSKRGGGPTRPNSLPGFVSWSTARFDRPSSPDWTLAKHLEDTSQNTLIDASMPADIKEDAGNKPSLASVDELPRRLGDGSDDRKLTPLQQRTQEEVRQQKAATEASGSNPFAGADDAADSLLSTNVIDETQHRFMSLHFEKTHQHEDDDRHDSPAAAYRGQSADVLVKCSEATAVGGVPSRCTVDNSVLCAPRHRSMLAALAMLPDPLPPHLQVATFGPGPTAVAAFMFKFFSQHLKRLDVITEPALVENTSIVDFGLTARHGPVTVTDMDDEQFLLRTDKKYDLLFVSTADPLGKGKDNGDIGETQKQYHQLSPDYVQLCRKSLSGIGVAAFELRHDDRYSQRVIRGVFGDHNVFMFSVPKSANDVVALAGYSLPTTGVHKRHIVHRAEDISFFFRLPYDLGAHLPVEWMFW